MGQNHSLALLTIDQSPARALSHHGSIEFGGNRRRSEELHSRTTADRVNGGWRSLRSISPSIPWGQHAHDVPCPALGARLKAQSQGRQESQVRPVQGSKLRIPGPSRSGESLSCAGPRRRAMMTPFRWRARLMKLDVLPSHRIPAALPLFPLRDRDEPPQARDPRARLRQLKSRSTEIASGKVVSPAPPVAPAPEVLSLDDDETRYRRKSGFAKEDFDSRRRKQAPAVDAARQGRTNGASYVRPTSGSRAMCFIAGLLGTVLAVLITAVIIHQSRTLGRARVSN